MHQSIAFYCGRYIPVEELTISPFDLGFVQGVTVAERARTFGGQIFHWTSHLLRLRRSLEIVHCKIPYNDDQLTQMAEHVVSINRQGIAADSDLGLCLFVTPGDGRVAAAERQPTVCIYTQPLEFAVHSRLYSDGQSLVVSQTRQTSERSWPRELKCRSRIHYYLADQEARRQDPTARALLLDEQDRVCEASTANLVAYFDGIGLISPPLEQILPGISLKIVETLARRRNVFMRFRNLSVDDLFRADELLLCSTSPCIVPVLRLNGQPVGEGRPGKVFRDFMRAWSELVGLDIIDQAHRHSIVTT